MLFVDHDQMIGTLTREPLGNQPITLRLSPTRNIPLLLRARL
jgi:hypothetical protein